MLKTKGLIIIILLLLGSNVLWLLDTQKIKNDLRKSQKTLEIVKTQNNLNAQILDFMKLFIQKVLKAEKEVSFEGRLELENAVRNLHNGEILDQWQKFTDSKTEQEAQKEVRNLLEILANKIVEEK